MGTGFSSLQQRLVNPDATPTLIPVTTGVGDPVLIGNEPFLIPAQTDPVLESTPVLTQFGDNRSGSVGLSVTIPIFDRFQTRRQVQLAQIEVDRQQIERDRLQQRVATEVRQALLDAQSAERQLAVALVQVEAARAALEAEKVRYELGAAPLVVVEQARARFVEARSTRAQAEYDLLFRRALIGLALGEIDPEESLFD